MSDTAINESTTNETIPVNTYACPDFWQESIQSACQRIAPTWPLDQTIAVNPWWEQIDLPFPKVAARMAALAGVRCAMPHHYYRERWRDDLLEDHLKEAMDDFGQHFQRDEILHHIDQEPTFDCWNSIGDLMDQTRDRRHRMAWKDEIIHQISQVCGSAFKRGGQLSVENNPSQGLYLLWLDAAKWDKGLDVLMGEKGLNSEFQNLPKDPLELLRTYIAELQIDPGLITDIAHALLLEINGWASWTSYLRWQAKLNGQPNDLVLEILAIRAAWDLVLWRHTHRNPLSGEALALVWKKQMSQLTVEMERQNQQQQQTFVWQRATEATYQDQLIRQLKQPSRARTSPPVLQAIFCIDVRSEVIRRALEAQHPDIQTLGFAGFFGLPIEYHPHGTTLSRPQLPGLLKPSIQATEVSPPLVKNAEKIKGKAKWKKVITSSPAMFSLVEATGLSSAFELLKDAFFPNDTQHPVNHTHGSSSHWTLTQDGVELTTLDKASLAQRILKNMGLSHDFAPRVMLVGHGSCTRNNPQAAGLDCGACGGQTGEVNVRILAQILNDPEVRTELEILGLSIPVETKFLAALHNTTSDDVTCFEHHQDAELVSWLEKAGAMARAERAPRLGLGQFQGEALDRAVRKRCHDWSQVRPEWGLADNACFVVAPRSRTRDLNLKGRSFLHDYKWQDDHDFAILEGIMTAPMLVTHWINMQYYASVTDPQVYGSGNKLLHNVVGGNLGIFEGNGGDLRIGLSQQSVFDGKELIHHPLRLSVFVAAPRGAIENVWEKHEVVKRLIDNQWLFLYRLDDDSKVIESFCCGNWTEK